jgi:hypothetical protein
MLVHKSCDLGQKPEGVDRRGIYFLGNVSMSFEPFGTPSGMGGMTIGIANDYSMGDGGSYISSIECYDCGKSISEFVGDIESYKLERILDERADDYDLVEDNGK